MGLLNVVLVLRGLAWKTRSIVHALRSQALDLRDVNLSTTELCLVLVLTLLIQVFSPLFSLLFSHDLRTDRRGKDCPLLLHSGLWLLMTVILALVKGLPLLAFLLADYRRVFLLCISLVQLVDERYLTSALVHLTLAGALGQGSIGIRQHLVRVLMRFELLKVRAADGKFG